ncbi:TonB-dependent receptor domain-containing protein [Halalkalibaculum sp. DA3122]|uniref:TonB-dependent receptor n=1 Tax=unclassified Halalkalibaculum TaxID=2964617 RepID=UPI0037543616
MRTLTIFAAVILLPALLAAQETASVNGYVTDSETGETLISANVALEGTRKGTSTNTSGYYTLTGIAPGEHVILVSYIGYQSYRREISLKPGESLRLDIELSPEGIQMDEIVVESEMEKEEQKNIGISQVQTELIKEVPSVFEADVFRAVQLLPGVKAASDFSSGLYIRGGSPDQTLILLDRTTVYNPTHFFGFFSTFNPDAVKDVRLYKGGYPAEYGGRLGSVLDIHNKDGNRNEFNGSASIGLLASRVSVEGPFEKGSYMLAVRRSTLEPLLAVLQESQDNIPESFYFLDLNGKVNYDADPDNKFSLAFYSGIDNLLFPFAEDASIKLNYGNQTISSTWTHIFSNKVFSNLTVTGSRYFNFPSFNIASTPFKRSNNIYDFSVKGDVEYQPGDRHSVSAGFWSGLMTLKVQDQFDGEDTFSSRIQSHYTSLYAQDEWAITDQVEMTAGLRLNGFSEGNYWKLAPRVSIEYQPVDEVRFQAAYGRYNQFLTLISNEAFSGFDTWLTTDTGVEPAYGDQYVVGAKTQPWEGYGLDMEIYYRTMEDLFDLNPFLPDVAGLDYPDLFRFGTGYAYGAEWMLERQVGRLTGFLGYTFSVSRRKYPGFNTPIGQPEHARFFPPKYDRKHDINLVMNYALSSRWKASAVFNYSTGQAYTKPLGRTVAFDFPTESQPLDALVIGKVNASRLPAYHRLDLGFTRSGSFFGMGEARWQFQLINVYSRRNVWFYNFNFDENPIEREEVTMLPVLPNISYTVNF